MADLLNDCVLPFFDSHGIPLMRILTDRSTEYCDNPEHPEHELYLAVENIDHTRTGAKSPQTHGIVERLHNTMLNEFYRVAFRKKIYDGIAAWQADLDHWLDEYNTRRKLQRPMVLWQDAHADFLDSLSPRTNSFLIQSPEPLIRPTSCQVKSQLRRIAV